MNISYNRALIFLCSTFLLCGCASGFIAKTSDSVKTSSGNKIFSETIEIKPPVAKFTLGEKLTYYVRWAGLSVGTIVASVSPEFVEINNRKAYEVKVVVKTNGFCSAIYRIDDEFVSYIDVESLNTLRHKVHRREGRYKKDAVTDFDAVAHTAHFKNFLDNSQKTFKIPENSQDTLSACYYFRTLKLNIKDRIKYNVVNNEQNYELFGVVEDKKFIKISELGEFESFFIQPYAKEINGEQVKKGRVSGYFSCDEKRLPLLAVVEAPVFTSVTATLGKIEYLGAASGRK